jgi:hypothetical protein
VIAHRDIVSVVDEMKAYDLSLAVALVEVIAADLRADREKPDMERANY